jgi:hypothetical protein
MQYTYIIMRNVKVMTIIQSIYWSAWLQLRYKVQENTETSKHINTEEAKKQNRRWREIHKERNNEELHNA